MNGLPARASLLALLLVLLPAAPARAKASFPWPDFDALAARFPGVGAVCLLDEREANLEDLGGDDYGKRERVRFVVAILDPARAADWLDRTLYDSEYHKVQKIDAKTWLAPDKSVEVQGSRIFDVASFPDYVLYQDVRGKRFAFPAVAPRTVIELRYHVLAREIYTVEHVFAHTIPTLESRLVLTVPRDWFREGFNQIVRGQGIVAEPEREILDSPDGEIVRLTWQMQSLPAIPIEHSMPPFEDVAPKLTIVPQPPRWENSSWSTLGRRYWEQLFVRRLSRGPEVTALAAQLTAGAANDEEKLARIARFLQSEIRYVAIELGIGGFQPHLADEVLRNRYGDCKDKVCLMLSLLAAAGIAGEPALVRTADAGALDTALVDLGQFNHMIARVRLADRVVWVDPTASNCALGYLPGGDQATFALITSAKDSRMEPTPLHDSGISPLELAVDGTLGADGRLTGTLTCEARGEAALEYRGAFRRRDASEERGLVEDLLHERLANARLMSYEVLGLDSLDVPFRLRVAFERDGAAMAIDRALVVLPELVLPAPPLNDAFVSEGRVHPVMLDCLRSWRDRVRIAPPAGYRVDAAIEPASFNGRYFAFTLAGRPDGEALVVEREVASRSLVVPARAYADARGELARIREAGALARVGFRQSP